MSEKTEITFMQTRLIRLASEEWHLPVEQIIHLFKEADVLGYIEKCYGIFHCEGDEAVLEDITEFANNSDRIFKQGDLIEEQKNQLEKLTLEIDDIESLLQDVSDVAYEKAVEEVTNEVMIKTRQDDIQLIEGTKNWIDQPQRKASEKEKNYAKNRLDGVIKKIMKAMTAVQTVKDSLLQPKTKVKVVNEIKEKARPSIMSRMEEKKKELAEREANKKNDLKKSWNRDDR